MKKIKHVTFLPVTNPDFQKLPDHPKPGCEKSIFPHNSQYDTCAFNGDLTNPIECLEFSNACICCLHVEGIYTLDVLTFFTEERLSKLPSIGTLGAMVIKETLERYNLAFQQ